MMGSASETQALLDRSIERVLSRHWSGQSACEAKPRPDIWSQFVELGLPAAELPASEGGLELGFADLAPSFQQLGRALATTYLNEFMIMGGWLVVTSETTYGRDITPRLASGEARIALAIGEYGDGGDIAYVNTSANQIGDGWQLDGAKAVVVGGDRATHLVVPAMIGPEAGKPMGELGLFLVSTEAVGLTAHAIELYDGSFAADFEFHNMAVPAEALIKRGSAAVESLELAVDRGRAALCHEIVGLVEKVSEITLDYVKTRRQFGQPIGTFQTMQHRMADMHMDLELARSCAELATSAIDSGGGARERMRTISAAMASICDCARKVGQSAVHAHGGIALTQDYVVGHYFKRLTLVERYLGNAEFHVERYIRETSP
jgi:alkylation response protein AidB-like acyl-CoA dehydrogenase